MAIGSLRNEAYDRIRGKLALGVWSAGSELSEPRLAALLGISRTPVREALQQLEVEGLVERTPRRSTFVRMPARRDILELFELREALESHAVGLAAQRHTAADIERLDSLCGQMGLIAQELDPSGDSTLAESSTRRWLAVELGFHLVLIQATGNRRLIKIVADSHVLSRVFGAPPDERPASAIRSIHRTHCDIFQAVHRAQVDRARELMVKYIGQCQADALAHFDNQQRDSPPTNPVDDLSLPDYLLSEFKRIGLPLRQFAGEKRKSAE